MNSKVDSSEMTPLSQTATKVNTDARRVSCNEPETIYLGSAKALGKIVMRLYPCGFQTRFTITAATGALIYTARVEQGADKHWYAMSGDHKDDEKSFMTIKEFAQACAKAHLHKFVTVENEKLADASAPVQLEFTAAKAAA